MELLKQNNFHYISGHMDTLTRTHTQTVSPWSRSEADTVSTLVPEGWFSEIWASYWVSSNQGTSSFTSITWTHSSWVDNCWGIPWSSAIIVRLKMSCSSRSRGLKIDREPVEERSQRFDNRKVFLSVCMCFITSSFREAITHNCSIKCHFPLCSWAMYLK